MLVDISMNVHEDILNGLKLQSGHNFVTETATYKVQRDITLKIYIQGLLFLCSARRLMLVNISRDDHGKNNMSPDRHKTNKPPNTKTTSYT